MGVFGDENLAVNAYIIAYDHVMLNDGKCSYAHMVSDTILFSYIDLVARLKVAPNAVACVNDGVGPDVGVRADDCRAFLVLLALGRHSKNAEVFDDGIDSHLKTRINFAGIGHGCFSWFIINPGNLCKLLGDCPDSAL